MARTPQEKAQQVVDRIDEQIEKVGKRRDEAMKKAGARYDEQVASLQRDRTHALAHPALQNATA